MRPCDQPHRYGRNWKKAELRPCFLLIYTAANSEKKKCVRATNLTDTAAIEKRQSCGRVSRSLQKRGFAHVFFGPYTFLSKKYLKGPPRCDTPPACRYAPFTFALVFLSFANARFESPCFFQQKRHRAGAFFVERRSGDSNPGAGNPT